MEGSACISLCIDRNRASEYRCRERSSLSRRMDRLANTVLPQSITIRSPNYYHDTSHARNRLTTHLTTLKHSVYEHETPDSK